MKECPIFESLVSCRNILLNDESNDKIIPLLHSTLDLLGGVSSEHSRNILEYCIGQSIDQVNEGHFKSAGLILNLIHNIPLSGEDLSRWNVDYFLSVEIPGFLDEFKYVVNSRNITLYVFGEVSKLYQPEA